jgi:hypothetical protein
MTKSALLRTTLETLRLLERGLTAYLLIDNGPCHLLLPDGISVKVSVAGTDIAPKFECFSLVLDVDKTPTESVTAFATPKDATAVSVLLREEYVAPFTGDPSHLVGQRPITHAAAKPGHVPRDALASCLVAYGLLIEGARSRLAVVADWFPFKIEATTDETRIAAYLGESEAVSIARYAELYGCS